MLLFVPFTCPVSIWEEFEELPTVATLKWALRHGFQNAYSEFATRAALIAARRALRALAACFFFRRTLGFSKYLRRRDSVRIPCC